MISLTIAKMVVMPIIGITSTWFLQRYFLDLPDGKLNAFTMAFSILTCNDIVFFAATEIDGTCYLVRTSFFV
jgi:hypothetical protein